jgi:hypothetical protein
LFVILLTLGLILSIAGTVHATSTARSASLTIANVQVSSDSFLAHSEPDVAENPVNPNNLVAGSKMFTDPKNYVFNIGMYYTTNAGHSWHDTGILPGFTSFYRTSDISVAFSPNGSIVYACVLAHDDSRSGIYVSQSRDGGKTWSQPTTVFVDPTGATFSDKPWITVDSSQRASRGSVYVAWNLDDNQASAGDPDRPHLRRALQDNTFQTGVVVSRSTDYAKTFSKPVVVRKFGPQNNNFALGAMPSVGPNGHVYVAYLTYDDVTTNHQTHTINRLVVAESKDQGQSFTARTAVDNVGLLPDSLPNGTFRNYSMPAFKVSPRDGTLLLAWADIRNHDSDILSSRSVDSGRTWSKPLRVNHDPIRNGVDQFQPALAVAPNGTFTCAWFDRRYSPGNRLIDEAMAQSTNGGKSFGTNIRVTKHSWDPAIDSPHPGGKATFIGDYQGLAVDNTRVHPLWNDTQNGETQEIRTAVVSVQVFQRR